MAMRKQLKNYGGDLSPPDNTEPCPRCNSAQKFIVFTRVIGDKKIRIIKCRMCKLQIELPSAMIHL